MSKRMYSRRRQSGRGFFDNLKSFAQKANKLALQIKPATIARDIIDRTGTEGMISGNPFGTYALKGLDYAKSKGYGRKRVVRRRTVGGSKTRRVRRSGSKSYRGGSLVRF